MSASDDFPRGVTLTNTNSEQAYVTFPALPAIAWVITSIDAQIILSNVATAQITTYGVGGTISGGATVGAQVLGAVAVEGDYTAADGSWTGQIMFPVATAVIVGFTSQPPGGSNTTQVIVAQGYPV